MIRCCWRRVGRIVSSGASEGMERGADRSSSSRLQAWPSRSSSSRASSTQDGSCAPRESSCGLKQQTVSLAAHLFPLPPSPHSIILFLNKIDIFKQKIPRIPLSDFFPEYSGGADVNKAAKYILWRFTQTNRARLSIFPHLTQATDTGNIRLVFAAVKETILQNALRDSGIL